MAYAIPSGMLTRATVRPDIRSGPKVFRLHFSDDRDMLRLLDEDNLKIVYGMYAVFPTLDQTL
jgi:hypothetical protein